MKVEDIHRVMIIGVGTMGTQIGLQCAMHGYEVTLYDIAPKMLENSLEQIKAFVAQLTQAGRLTPEAAAETLARIRTTSNAQDAAQGVDLISESVPEDPKLKGKVFAQFNQLCGPHTIFTTNSSTLKPSQFAQLTGRPEKLLALHFHPYVWDSNVVDVMPHPKTSPETVRVVTAFARKIGQIPIMVKKETGSYVFNAMLGGFLGEAMNLVLGGVADYQDVDRAWMGIMKMPAGPFGIMDLIGLDTMYHIHNYWAKRFFFIRRLRRQADFFKSYVDQGKLGIKSGQGFYTYPEPAFQQPGFVEGKDN